MLRYITLIAESPLEIFSQSLTKSRGLRRTDDLKGAAFGGGFQCPFVVYENSFSVKLTAVSGFCSITMSRKPAGVQCTQS